MADPLAADPEPDTEPAHFYLTAVPTQGLPDMLLRYTRDRAAHHSFLTAATEWHNAIARADVDKRGNPPKPIAFERLMDFRRGQRPHGAWFVNYPLNLPDQRLGGSRRMLGLDDDATVRFIDMAAGSLPNGMHPAVAEYIAMGGRGGTLHTRSVLNDSTIWWETLDLVRMIGWIAEASSYRGAWLLGTELGRMRGRWSGECGNHESDADQLTATSRVTARQLLDQPREVASALLRPLFPIWALKRS